MVTFIIVVLNELLAAALGHQLIELEVRCKLFPAIALVQELQPGETAAGVDELPVTPG